MRAVVGAVFVAALLGVSGKAQAQDDAMAKRGKMLWVNRGCAGCHGIGKKMAGPDLAGIEQRRSREWLDRWFKETDVMQREDSVAIALVAEWNNIKMPKQVFTDQDIEAILSYLRSEQAKMSARK